MIHIRLATEFIYGNAIRDASGLVEVKDFPNTADLNAISEELNKIVRTAVIPPVKGKIKKGNRLSMVAALELNKEHIHWQGVELYPVRIQILPMMLEAKNITKHFSGITALSECQACYCIREK